MTYQVAERFKSLQGEGLFTGTPMAFIRFVGCSVGKRVCHFCDTDFDKVLPWRGGGTYNESELIEWSNPYEHLCLTGGEPLDQDLAPLMILSQDLGHRAEPKFLHIETSGTKRLDEVLLRPTFRKKLWVCVSPKPGYLEDVVQQADEIKVIVPGLGNGPGWPQLETALRWAAAGKLVFLQPRNGKFDIDHVNLMYVQDLLKDYPTLRLSVQAHKILKVQ